MSDQFKLNPEIKKAIENSVLCWLATSTTNGEPNVSPKEVFTDFDDKYIIVANIASPNSLKNIKANPHVCISFIDVFVQKGFKIKGLAEIVNHESDDYDRMEAALLKMTQGMFPFKTITKIEIRESRPIIAPKYILYPETTENDQVKSALETYEVKKKIGDQSASSPFSEK